ncbi:PREDICTED: uncharacterized protein LOC103592645 [Galeopterus variegatus]|uniref:Uncharacterized protein LOC103592645 n=1 Tax=Galeopterus variegatus TaxID=482537 RepID=A0ABM0QZ82_GALVR|nr:PREDICTED: uncharacterized protein LOC103592645 [Galeopterus variegatus]
MNTAATSHASRTFRRCPLCVHQRQGARAAAYAPSRISAYAEPVGRASPGCGRVLRGPTLSRPVLSVPPSSVPAPWCVTEGSRSGCHLRRNPRRPPRPGLRLPDQGKLRPGAERAGRRSAPERRSVPFCRGSRVLGKDTVGPRELCGSPAEDGNSPWDGFAGSAPTSAPLSPAGRLQDPDPHSLLGSHCPGGEDVPWEYVVTAAPCVRGVLRKSMDCEVPGE